MPAVVNAVNRLSKKLDNGINDKLSKTAAKVDVLWKLQWWQIGIMVTLIGSIFGVGFYVVSQLVKVNTELVHELNKAITELGRIR